MPAPKQGRSLRCDIVTAVSLAFQLVGGEGGFELLHRWCVWGAGDGMQVEDTTSFS